MNSPAPPFERTRVFEASGPRLGLAVLMAVTAWVYWGSLTAPFHFDDALFLQSARVTDPRAWLSNLDPTRLRQFTYLTFHWNYLLGKSQAAGYHAVNVLLHLGNVFLLYTVAGLFLAKHRAASGAALRWLPLAAAAVFALHPIQSEAVNYVYQRSVLLAGLFALLSAWLLLTPGGIVKRRLLGCGAALSWLLAVASKESAAVIPLVALPYIACSRSGPLTLRSVMSRHRAAAPTAAAAVVLTGSALAILRSAGERTVGLSLIGNAFSYALAQVQVFAAYLRLLIWPQGLTIDHAFRPAPPLSLSGVACGLLLAAVALLIAKLRRKDPVAAFLGAAFLILLVPTSSVVPSTDLMFEHRLYLPMMAGSCLAAWGAWRSCRPWARSPGRVTVCVAAAAVLLAGCAAVARSRTFVWSDDARLWEDAVLKAPWSPRAHYNLGVAKLSTDRGAARTEFLNTLRLRPDYSGALYNLGWLEERAGRLDAARGYYSRTLAADPAFWQADQSLANLLVLQGKLDEAERHYEAVITHNPGYRPAYSSLAALQLVGKCAAAALSTLERLEALAPDLPDALVLRAEALIRLRKATEAERELRRLESTDSAANYKRRIEDLRGQIASGATSDSESTQQR